MFTTTITDRCCGILGLTISGLMLSLLFFLLIILPVLPLSDDNILLSFPQESLLLVCGLTGLIFIGTLSIFSVYYMLQQQN